MTYPKITIVTPSYNQGQFLEQTIDSVLSQGYPNLEYMVVDGGSEDTSLEIIKKYEKHLAFWVSEKDKGQSDAINKGLAWAKGDVFNWLNSDDYYLPGALKRVGEVFLDPATNVFCGKSQIVQNGRVQKLSTGTDIYPGNLPKTIGWARIDQPETFFRKSVFDNIGPLNDSLQYVMDKELWMRYLIKYGLGQIQHSDDLLVAFRLHDTSKTQSQQSGFEQETNGLFRALASQYGFQDFESEIEKWGYANHSVQKFDEMEKSLAEEVLNYFFYYQFSRNYAQNNFAKAGNLRAFVQPELLAREDQVTYEKLSHRMRYPVAVKKLANWWSWLSR